MNNYVNYIKSETAVDLVNLKKCRKQVKLLLTLHTHARPSELQSIISTIVIELGGKDFFVNIVCLTHIILGEITP